jgi:hypothetical protein
MTSGEREMGQPLGPACPLVLCASTSIYVLGLMGMEMGKDFSLCKMASIFKTQCLSPKFKVSFLQKS